AWKRSEHHKLRKGETSAARNVEGGLKCLSPVRRQSENERAKNMYAVAPEFLQPADQVLSGTIKVFIDALQPLGSDGFHAHQSAFNVRSAHGIEKLRVLRGFHSYLGEEDHIFGQRRQTRHQLKTFVANGLQLCRSLEIILPLCQLDVRERNRVEVVISQGDEAITQPAQLDNFFQHCVGCPLPWFLAVCAPYRAKGAMLGT